MTRVLLVVAMLAAAACGDDAPAKIDAPPGGDDMLTVDMGPDRVARGRYIVNNLGVCSFCHTPLNPDGTRDLTRLLAGWGCNDPIPFFDADPTPGVGCLSSRNLTNHPTGLMNVTDQQIRDAIRNGTRADGKKLVPIMPYYIFHNMTDDDLDSVIAYLRTVPGVDNTVPPNEAPWTPINDNDTTSPVCTGGTCTVAPIDPATEIPLPVNPVDMASAMRGRYLSSMVGLCIDCHTTNYPPPAMGAPPPLFPRPLDMTKAWSGGRVFPKDQLGLVDPSYPDFITTRNLTPHMTGLQGFTVTQIEDAIARGKDPMGNGVCAATHGSTTSPYAALDPGDLTDIANYIKALPPVDNDTMMNCEGPPVP